MTSFPTERGEKSGQQYRKSRLDAHTTEKPVETVCCGMSRLDAQLARYPYSVISLSSLPAIRCSVENSCFAACSRIAQ